jgi:hypothetical protein
MFQYLKKIEKDTWVILLLIFISTYSIFNLKHWNKEDRIIAYDVVSYYSYLPATFIYDDVTLSNPNEKFNEYQHTFWYHETEEGNKIFKTSMGMAILYSPFFFLTHFYALASDQVANGFSSTYKLGIALSSLFYFIVGIIFLQKLLRKFYSKNIVAYTLLFIGLGTNFYYYTVIGVGMPHIYLFSLLATTAYLTIKWFENPSFKIAIFLGSLFGLMILVRPTMIIVLLFPLLYKLNSFDSIKERFFFLKKYIPQLLVMMIFAFIIWIPQFSYWKMASGNYLFYSYTEEGFFFNDPQILNALFSFRKGWLLYTPIMFFALIGLVLMMIKKEKIIWSLITTIVIYFYVASSWWDWWFGGSFGYRTMIDVMPLIAFGLAYFIQYISAFSKLYKTSIFTLIFILLAFNLFQTRQAHEGLLHHDSMTKAAYLKILFKLQSQITREEVKPYLKTPDYDGAKKGKRNQ